MSCQPPIMAVGGAAATPAEKLRGFQNGSSGSAWLTQSCHQDTWRPSAQLSTSRNGSESKAGSRGRGSCL